MKNLTIFLASILLLLSLTMQHVVGSASIPSAGNRQEFENIIDEMKLHATTEVLKQYPFLRLVGVHTTKKIKDFNADDTTVVCLIKIKSDEPILVKDTLIPGHSTIAEAEQTIKLSEQLFRELKKEQSCCRCTIS